MLWNHVASACTVPPASVCVTPASTLRLRSGFRPGLSVNAISKASGGRMPVPAAARSRVEAPRVPRSGTAIQLA